MNTEQEAAYIIAQAAVLVTNALGMHAENMYRSARDEVVAYVEEDFTRLVNASGCNHNAVLLTFRA